MITVQPPAPLSALEEVQSSDNSPLSSLDAYPVMKAEPSPFSSRPVMFEMEEVSVINLMTSPATETSFISSYCQVENRTVSVFLSVSLISLLASLLVEPLWDTSPLLVGNRPRDLVKTPVNPLFSPPPSNNPSFSNKPPFWSKNFIKPTFSPLLQKKNHNCGNYQYNTSLFKN